MAVACTLSVRGKNSFSEKGVVTMSNQSQLLCLQTAKGLADSN